MAKTPSLPPMTDARRAEEHFRLALDPRYLGTATALLVCCDRHGRPVAHLHVLGCDVDATASECAETLDLMLERVDAELLDVVGLSLGLTRPGGEHVQSYDRAWFRACYRVCHRRGLAAHGVYVVSAAGARAVHVDDAA